MNLGKTIHFELNICNKRYLNKGGSNSLQGINCKGCLNKNRKYIQIIKGIKHQLCNTKYCNKLVPLPIVPEFLKVIGSVIVSCSSCKKQNKIKEIKRREIRLNKWIAAKFPIDSIMGERKTIAKIRRSIQ